MNTLEKIENEVSFISNLKSQLLVPKKLALHTGLEGFKAKDIYGIFRNTGGDALGYVGKVFEPMNLGLFLDTIVESVEGVEGLDITKLKYNEYKGGAKVIFELPLKKFEIKTSKMKGDVLETKLQFRTGFDGLTKVSLGHYSYRVWCSNGSANWQSDSQLAFKNTLNNQAKLCLFTAEIMKAVEAVKFDVKMLEKSALVEVANQAEIDEFLTALTGYNVADYNELTKRKRNILDAINESIMIEAKNTGWNRYSLLQGVTRYTTHNLAEGDVESILFSNADKLNKKAHQLAFAGLN